MIVYRVHWLRAKATKDRWKEEEELLVAEFDWTVNFFQDCARHWEIRGARALGDGKQGPACYASRQMAIYSRLQDQCWVAWEGLRPAGVDKCAEGSPS